MALGNAATLLLEGLPTTFIVLNNFRFGQGSKSGGCIQGVIGGNIANSRDFRVVEELERCLDRGLWGGITQRHDLRQEGFCGGCDGNIHATLAKNFYSSCSAKLPIPQIQPVDTRSNLIDRTPPIDVTIPKSIGDQPGDLGRIGEAIGFSGVLEGAIAMS